MLIFSMSVSIDGFIKDRNGEFAWGGPSDEQFAFHLAEVSGLGSYLCGRRLYEAMTVWDTDPSIRSDALRDSFADAWSALPKVVFSHSLESVQGNARLAQGSLTEEVSAALEATDGDVSIGGADLAGQAIELGLVDELHMFRYPVALGGGTPFIPAVRDQLEFELVETRTFASRVVYECYRHLR